MLKTERLIIRFFREADGDDLYEYMSLEETYRFEPGNPVSREDSGKIASERASGENFLAVTLKENGKLIGHISLFPSGSEQFNTREIGYIFNPVFQNQGYCTEAVRAVIRYAFNELQIHRIVAFCSPENIPSWRVMEKCGLRQEALYHKNAFFRTDRNGNPVWFDSFEYAILKTDFERISDPGQAEGITLRPVDRSNWKQCLALQLHEHQKKFVASNMFSLAEAKIHPTFIPLAVYHGNVMVGFIMYGIDPDDGNYWISRLMIDREHQHRGYGKAAMKQVIERLKESPNCTSVCISHNPDNEVANRLYTGLGFIDTDRIVDGEKVMRLVLSSG